MSKKIKIVLLSFLVAPILAFAQDASLTIPNPGTTPGSILYVFDKLAEGIQNLFTINPVAKARLQLRLSAERIAELQYLIDKKGIEAKEIEPTQERLTAHLAKANGIVEKQRSSGKDMAGLADELSEDTEALEDATEDMFQKQIDEQTTKSDRVETDIEGLKGEGASQEEIAKLEAELDNIDKKIETLDAAKEKQLEIISGGETLFYKMINPQQKASKRLRGIQGEQRKLSSSERRSGISSPAENRAHADDLVNRANAEFAKGNFEEAAKLALNAKNEIITLRERIDDASKRAKNLSRGRGSQQERTDNRLAQSRIKQADSQRAGVIRLAQNRGVTLPPNVLKTGDDLLAQARAALGRDDREAERFARGAKNMFLILKANIKAEDKIGEDFEAELERERIEFEIRNRIDDDVFHGDIRIKRAELRVTAEIFGNNALGKVEVKFGTTLQNRNEIAQEITRRMKLTRDEVSRLLVIEPLLEAEDLRDRLEAKARVRARGTEAEAKLRTPIALIIPSPTPTPIIGTQTLVTRSNMTIEWTLSGGQITAQLRCFTASCQVHQADASVLRNNQVLASFNTNVNRLSQPVVLPAQGFTFSGTIPFFSNVPVSGIIELQGNIDDINRQVSNNRIRINADAGTIEAVPAAQPAIPAENQRQQIIDGIFNRVSTLTPQNILDVMEFRVDKDVNPSPTMTPGPTPTP